MNKENATENTIAPFDQQSLPARSASQSVCSTCIPWYDKYPWLTFVLGSPLILILYFIINFLLVGGLVSLGEGYTVETNPLLMKIVFWTSQTIAYLPAIIAAMSICWLVNRSGRKRIWALAACGIISLLASLIRVRCTLPETEPGTGSLTVALVLNSHVWKIGLRQMSQAFPPLLIGCIYAFPGSTSQTRDPKATHQNNTDAKTIPTAA